MSREFELLIYSDVACPWCYIGWARLKKALNADKMKEYKFTLKPRFMPYLINESLDKDPVTKEQLYSEKFMGGDSATAVRNKISSEGEKDGITFNWDKNAKVRQTKDAHRVIEKAYEMGGFDLQAQIAEILYKAFNEEGKDVGDPEILASLCASVPNFLSKEEALKFISSEEGLYELDKALEKTQYVGIDSVPFYILDETDSYTQAIQPEEWFKHFDVLQRAYGLT